MKLNNDVITQFDSELLFEAVVEGAELFIFENRINYSCIPVFEELTLSMAKKLRSTIVEFYEGGEDNFCNIIEFKSNADIEPSAREWGANRPDGITSVSDAIIVRGLPQRIIANFYLKINRPKKPTKFFNNLADSISWSLEQLEKKHLD